MSEEKEKRTGFLGTYFNSSAVLRTAWLAKIAAWFVLAAYGLSGGNGIVIYFLMLVRKTWWGPGITDHLNYVVPYIEKIAQGVFFFVVLLAIAHLLEVSLDTEDNARRAARQK
jgi:hypothetical protein